MPKAVIVAKRDLSNAASVAAEKGVIVRVERDGVTYTFDPHRPAGVETGDPTGKGELLVP